MMTPKEGNEETKYCNQSTTSSNFYSHFNLPEYDYKGTWGYKLQGSNKENDIKLLSGQTQGTISASILSS